MDISTKTDRTLVLGLGNQVMTDDSAGLVALDRFTKTYEVDSSVDFMDGGTLGLELLVYLEGYRKVLMVDCIMGKGAPGTVTRIEAEDVPAAFQNCLSPHQMGIQDLMAVLELQGRVPENLTVVGMEGKSIDLGTELSPEVEKCIPEAVKLVAEVLEDWGIEVTLKKPSAA